MKAHITVLYIKWKKTSKLPQKSCCCYKAQHHIDQRRLARHQSGTDAEKNVAALMGCPSVLGIGGEGDTDHLSQVMVDIQMRPIQQIYTLKEIHVTSNGIK